MGSQVSSVALRTIRQSLTTLVAVRGASRAGLGVAECANCSGANQVDPDGSNRWVRGAATNQSYLVLDDADLAGRAIDALLCQPPKKRHEWHGVEERAA